MSATGLPLPTPLLGDSSVLTRVLNCYPTAWYLLPAGAALVAAVVLLVLLLTRRRGRPYPWLMLKDGATGGAAVIAAGIEAAAFRSRRFRRRALAVLCASVMAICFVWLTLLCAAEGGSLNQFKPAWWLMAQAGVPNDPDRALDELASRLEGGTLSDGQVAAIVSRTLEYQLDPQRYDSTEWGKLVEHARALGKVPAASWQQYLWQGLSAPLELAVRERVCRGDPLPARLRLTGPRLGRSRIRVTYEFDQTLTVAGRAVGDPTPRTATLDLSKTEDWAIDMTPARLASLPNGKYLATATVLARAYDSPGASAPAASVVLTPTTAWFLVPPAPPTVTAVVPPPAPPDSSRWVFPEIRHTQAFPDEYSILLSYSGDAHVDLAFRAFLRTRDGEIEIGSGTTSGPNSLTRRVRRLPDLAAQPEGWAGPVDLVLRPSRDAAIRSVDCYRYWDGVVVIPSVNIRP